MPPTSPEPLFAAFGAAVRALRKGRGLSQEALAERAQLHRSYVTDIELGRRNVSLYNIRQLAVALGVPMADLIREVERRGESGGQPRAADGGQRQSGRVGEVRTDRGRAH